MPIFKELRVVLGWSRYSDAQLYMLGLNVFQRMKNNPFFPDPPVSLADLEHVLDKHRGSMAATVDGGNPQAYAEKDHWRAELTLLLRRLAHYVDDTCKGDPANTYMLVSSGFEAQPQSRTSPQPLDIPRILRIKQGQTGELIIYPTPLGRQAKFYYVDWKPVNEPDTPEAWKQKKAPSARGGVRIDNLNPATVYAFRVCAFGNLGLTDWSPIVTRMCI
jgi:hypothetical protein